MSSDAMLQALGRRLVEREIHYCVSSLIYALSQREQDGSDGIDPDDLASVAYREPDADDYRDNAPETLTVEQAGEAGWRWRYEPQDDGDPGDDGIEPSELAAWKEAYDAISEDAPAGSEVYEHWIVSDWLAEKLQEQGEPVCRDLCGLTIWGRCTTGQAIALDHVIQQIALAAYGEPEPEPAAVAAHRLPLATMQLYRDLADGLSDMVEGGRLSEGDVPDDYRWLVGLLVQIAGADPSGEPSPIATIRANHAPHYGDEAETGQ